MSVRPDDFLAWAKNLPRASEIDLRCVVSRAYYGAFHACLQRAQAMHLDMDDQQGSHARLIHVLRRHRNGRLRQAGRMLKIAKDLRVEADYFLGQTIEPCHADNAIETVEAILGLLESLSLR